MKQDYLPNDEGAQSTWAQTFKTEAAKTANSAGMGWDGATVSAVTAAAQNLVDAIGAKAGARNTYLAAVAAADAKIAAALALIRPAVAAGKNDSIIRWRSARRWVWSARSRASRRRRIRRSCGA